MKNLSLVLVLVLSFAFMQSCEKEPIVADPIAPDLPIEQSFLMPFDGFQEDDSPKTFGNWIYAASNVFIWNTILTVNLAVPVASFQEAFNHNAQFQGNATWLWAYGFDAEGGHFTAELYGTILNSNEVAWEMHISKSGAFTDVVWYTGITTIDQTYASWSLNHHPYNPSAFLGIEYHADNDNGASSIRYTNIMPNNQGNGGYIEYQESLDPSMQFNRSYDVYKVEINNLLDIDWNNMTNEGRVKDPQKFQDGEWHCWNYELLDTQC
jgi:hypothetical protein